MMPKVDRCLVAQERAAHRPDNPFDRVKSELGIERERKGLEACPFCLD